MKYFKGNEYRGKSSVKNIEEKDSFLLVELEDTIFYPGGGGQPCDTGFIKTKDFEGEVIEVSKKEDKIIHKVKPVKGNLKENDNVDLEIDKEKRLRLVKMHTGEHVLFKSLEKVLGEIKLVKINLHEDESSLFIEAKDVTWDKVFEAEKLCNEMIEKNIEVKEKEYTIEDAVKLGKLRIKPERIKSDTVRVVEVDGFDWSACTGTHAESTGVVGNLLITKFNVVKGNYELRFKTDVKKEFFEYAKITRKISSMLSSDTKHIISSVERLQKEVEDYKEKFRLMSAKLLNHNNSEDIKGINFVWNVVEGVEKKQMTDKVNEIMKQKTIICFISTNERATALLSISKDLKIDAPDLLNKALSKFNGRGGGRDNFAMGSLEIEHIENFLTELKKLILDNT